MTFVTHTWCPFRLMKSTHGSWSSLGQIMWKWTSQPFLHLLTVQETLKKNSAGCQLEILEIHFSTWVFSTVIEPKPPRLFKVLEPLIWHNHFLVAGLEHFVFSQSPRRWLSVASGQANPGDLRREVGCLCPNHHHILVHWSMEWKSGNIEENDMIWGVSNPVELPPNYPL